MSAADGIRQSRLDMRPPVRRYGIAILTMIAAFLLMAGMQREAAAGIAPLLLLAVAIGAFVGGTVPGLIVAFTTAVIAHTAVFQSFALREAERATTIVPGFVFLMAAVSIALVGGAARRSRTRAEAAAAALTRSEARYRALVEAAVQVDWTWDPHGRNSDDAAVQAWWEAITGQSPAAQSARDGHGWIDAVHPDDRARVTAAWEMMLAGTRYDIEYRIRAATGEDRYVRARAVPVYGSDGTVSEFVGMMTETTAHYRAAAALQASEARLRSVFESDMIGIAFWDGERVTEANDAMLRLLGYEREDLPRGLLRHGKLTPPEYAAADRHATDEVIARGACTPYEKEFFRKDGSRVPVLVGGALLGGDRRNGVFFVLDLSERRRAEENLQAIQRLETAGRLAGGVAHETNNQMSVVLGAVHFLLRRRDLADDVRPDLEHIRRAAEHTAALTRQLLAFSRRQVLQPRAVDLNAEVEALAPVMRRTLGPPVTLALHLASDAGSVRADPGQLTQVLLNLILNARDAMPDGGTVTITTSTATLDGSKPALAGEIIVPGSYAVLTVADTGVGMDRDTLGRAFEPFFTTKPVGEGTGLGLSTVHGIVRQSNGYVTIDSAPGRGTTCTLYLPQSTERLEHAVRIPPTEQPTGQANAANPNSATILVVDDQPHVRMILARALRADGYGVLEAGSPAEALAVFEDGVPVDLVVTDLVMPEMSGSALARRLTAHRPDVPVLFTSGHADEEVRRRGLLDPDRPFLQKPYAPEVLVDRVRRLLAEEIPRRKRVR